MVGVRKRCLTACCCLILGCVEKTRPALKPTASIADQQAAGAILAEYEGEKLFLEEGRYVLLKVDSKVTGSQKLLMGLSGMPVGSAVPVHRHDAYEEIIFLHKGNVTVSLGDRRVSVTEGTTMYIPPGTWHGVENTGPNEATILGILPAPEFGDFFRETGYHEGEPPKELTRREWDEIMAKHQMRAKRE